MGSDLMEDSVFNDDFEDDSDAFSPEPVCNVFPLEALHGTLETLDSRWQALGQIGSGYSPAFAPIQFTAPAAFHHQGRLACFTCTVFLAPPSGTSASDHGGWYDGNIEKAVNANAIMETAGNENVFIKTEYDEAAGMENAGNEDAVMSNAGKESLPPTVGSVQAVSAMEHP
ncbi:Uu.00g032330.m01.CDS01 [Anthostomella pinea]|uniref:Uu.00g032330.m01.CDS01 n=1 Tax=Anthostomella pinea TaxID=933095 RepID=A0AAI8V9N6_9PEZI|nr:Uu.00g032330.m01.CDS01 [Anthostomella pinea]